MRKRWTVEEFHQLLEHGWFDDCRPILLDGTLFELAKPGPAHNTATGLADYLLKNLLGSTYWVRIQMPLVLGNWTDPVPDIAVVVGTPDDYPDNPTTAELIIEVADSSLAIDLGEKATLYAAAGIVDYWVVDLNSRRLIVHRDQQPDGVTPSASSYRQVISLDETGAVQPIVMPTTTVRVADLLPRQFRA